MAEYLGAIAGAPGSVLKAAQLMYELKAVSDETYDLLNTINHTKSVLKNAQALRRKKSCYLNVEEKGWIDSVMADTTKTINDVADLIESSRVDLETKGGRIRPRTRVSWVFKHSPKVSVQLAKLGTSVNGLNAAMVVLCTRQGDGIATPGPGLTQTPSVKAENAKYSRQSDPLSDENFRLLVKRRQSRTRPSNAPESNHHRLASSISLPTVNFDRLGLDDASVDRDTDILVDSLPGIDDPWDSMALLSQLSAFSIESIPEQPTPEPETKLEWLDLAAKKPDIVDPPGPYPQPSKAGFTNPPPNIYPKPLNVAFTSLPPNTYSQPPKGSLPSSPDTEPVRSIRPDSRTSLSPGSWAGRIEQEDTISNATPLTSSSDSRPVYSDEKEVVRPDSIRLRSDTSSSSQGSSLSSRRAWLAHQARR